MFREGAAWLLDAEGDLTVVGRCGSVEEALEILGSTDVDLVLLDVDLGRERGFQFFKPARENGFGGRVLVVAAVLSVFEARRLMQAGASRIDWPAPGMILSWASALVTRSSSLPFQLFWIEAFSFFPNR